MKVTLDILLLLTCGTIVFQDLKDRMISVFLLGMVGMGLIVDFSLYHYNESNLEILLSNYLFVIGQLSFLYLYFVYLRRTQLSFFDQVMGWGDIIMVLCMALAFPLPQLILYLLIAYGTGIVFALFSKTKNSKSAIPLAGFMALLYLLNLGIYYFTGHYLIESFAA